MSNDNQLMNVRTDDVDAFVNGLAAVDASQRPTVLSPKRIKLDGNDGQYSITTWNELKKEKEERPFGDNNFTEFKGTVLFVRYFAQWKFKEDSSMYIRTREFSTFDEPIELLVKDNNQKEAEAKSYHFENYADLKKVKGVEDDITGTISYPFDFWVSLYLYIPEMDEVVNFRFKGDTRSNFFMFMNVYRKDMGIKHYVEASVMFGRQEKMMPAKNGKPPKKYYAGTFTVMGVNYKAYMEKVMLAFNAVKAWMASFVPKKAEVVSEGQILPPMPRNSRSGTHGT